MLSQFSPETMGNKMENKIYPKSKGFYDELNQLFQHKSL